MTKEQKEFIEFQMKLKDKFIFTETDKRKARPEYKAMLVHKACSIWNVSHSDFLPNECWEAYLWQP